MNNTSKEKTYKLAHGIKVIVTYETTSKKNLLTGIKIQLKRKDGIFSNHESYNIFLNSEIDVSCWSKKNIQKLLEKLTNTSKKNVRIALNYYEMSADTSDEILTLLDLTEKGRIFYTKCNTTEELTKRLDEMHALDNITLKPSHQDKVDYVEDSPYVYTNNTQSDRKYRWIKGSYIWTDMGILGYIA